MPRAGVLKSSLGDSLTASRSVMSVRNVVFIQRCENMDVAPARHAHYLTVLVVYCNACLCVLVIQVLSLQFSCRMVRSSARVGGSTRRDGGHGPQGIFLCDEKNTAQQGIDRLIVSTHEAFERQPRKGWKAWV